MHNPNENKIAQLEHLCNLKLIISGVVHISLSHTWMQ